MTPVFCCGFECGLFGTVGQHFSIASGSPAFSTSTVRSGARSVFFDSAASSTFLVSPVLTATGMWVIRVYIYFTTLPSATTALCRVSGGVGGGGAYFSQSDSKIYAGTSGVSLGSTGVLVTTNTWYLLDVKSDMTGNPWLVDVKVNGIACGQLSIGNAPQPTQDKIYIGNVASTTGAFYMDDIIASNTAADYPIGAGYVNHFIPTSDGTHNIAGTADFRRTLTATDILNSTTDAYLLVDDIPLIATDISAVACISMIAPVNAGDYVECVFGPAPGISTPTVAPRAVDVIGALQTASAGGSPTMDISLRINDNGTTGDVFTSSVFYQPSTPTFKRAQFATPPTGGAWTVVSGAGNFNNLRARFGSFDAADTTPDGYFGTIMVEAEFAPAVAGTGLLPFCISPQPTR
jgi:hypothetical protein